METLLNSNSTLNRPLVFDFTDYRLYIKTLFEYEKSVGEFSYAVFAMRAGFQARSYLRTVITGKRNLSTAAIDKVIVGFNLSLNESEAFRCLVYFNQSQTFTERTRYWERFLKLRPKKASSIIVDEYNYLARMAYPILLVIMKQAHVLQTPEELARLTNLSVSEVREGLETLVKIGALVKTDENKYAALQNNFQTQDDMPNVAVQKFHSNILEKAKESLSLPTSKREFQSLMLALSESEFQYLKKRLKNFCDEIENLYCGPRPLSERVYSINLNLVPISPDFIRPSQRAASQKSEEHNLMSLTSEEKIV
jgi:uncharacterized protein (TIGR02147 family)